MIEWPINLAQSLQNLLIKDNITDPEPLLNAYKSNKELLNSDVFDLFLPQQPGLLTWLILFGIATALFFVLFGVFCIARFLGHCGSELYQKHPTKSSKFIWLSAGFAINWLLLAVCTAFIVSCIIRLGNGGRAVLGNSDEIPINMQQLNKTKNGPVKITFNTITITDIDSHKRVQFGEADLLNKYNNIRELGYEFRPMENDADVHTQVVLFSTLSFILAAILAITGTSFIIGSREFLYSSYHPMDRSHNSNSCGRIFVASAMALLFSAPLMLLISIFLMAYIQAHSGICPFVQADAQNRNIEMYANANFDYFDPYNLLDFLNDLTIDRTQINHYNCDVFVRPLQGIWISLLFLSVAVLPACFIILRLSKYFLRMSASNYWNPTETYNTINEKTFQGTPFKSVYPPTIRY